MDRSTSAGTDGLIVLCAANNWDDVRLSDRPLAEALAKHRPVLYVDPPLSHMTARRNPRLATSVRRPRLHRYHDRLWRLTPVVTPWVYRAPVVPLTRLLTRGYLRRALRRLQPVGSHGSAVVSTWLDVDVFDLVPDGAHAYWVQDDVASGAALWGLDPDRLVAAERRVAASADVVLVANPVTVPLWRSAGHRAEALPNGCDPTRFDDEAGAPASRSRPPELPTGPVAGFVGHLNARTDLGLLRAVVGRGVSVVLVGPIDPGLGRELDDLLALPGVVAVGPQPFEDLPSWFAGIDVGLLPYRNDEFNRASFPLKTLEYLVAGLPVVSTALPASRWLECPDVALADDPAEFAARTAQLARHPREAEDVRRRREFARAHSWDARARSLVSALTPVER